MEYGYTHIEAEYSYLVRNKDEYREAKERYMIDNTGLEAGILPAKWSAPVDIFPDSYYDGTKLIGLPNGKILAIQSRGDGGKLLGQLLNADGSKLRGPFLIHKEASDLNPRHAAADVLTDGRVIIVWEEASRIMGQIIDASGQKIGEKFTVKDSSLGGEQLPLGYGTRQWWLRGVL